MGYLLPFKVRIHFVQDAFLSNGIANLANVGFLINAPKKYFSVFVASPITFF